MNAPSADLPRAKAPVSVAVSTMDHLLIRDILRVILVDWKVFSGILAATLLAGAFYLCITPWQYLADVLVQIEKKSRSITSPSDDLYDLMAGRDSTSTEIALLKSRLVLGKVVDDLHLDLESERKLFPVIGQIWARAFPESAQGQIELASLDLPEALLGKSLLLRVTGSDSYTLEGADYGIKAEGRSGQRVQFESASGSGSIFVREVKAPAGAVFELRKLHRLEVIQNLAVRLQVAERGRQSGILDISLEGKDAAQVTAIVNAIAAAYQRQNVERRSAEAEQTLVFVDEQLPRVRQALETAENALNRYRLEQKSADLTKETELVLQQSVSLEQRRVELQQKREEALRKFTANHPIIQGIDGQLGQIGEEQKHLATRVEGLPETQQELLRLSRDVTVNNALYTTLLNSAEQLRLAKAGTVGNVRIVDFAEPAFRPVRPARGMIMAFSMLSGVFLGLVAVFIRRALHTGITDPAILERMFDLPTFATIPNAPAQTRITRMLGKEKAVDGLLTHVAPYDLAVEAIRSLRTAVQADLSGTNNKVVLVCGPTSGIGKSFVSLNLSAALALAGRRVVLIDVDLRRGHLHKNFIASRDKGLTDFIGGRHDIPDIIHPSTDPNLFFVPTGPIPSAPAELLLNDRFEQAIRELSARFDYVIVDSAPVLAVTDAIIASRTADMILMVLRSGEHSVRQVEETIRRFTRGGQSIRAAIINQVGHYKTDIYGAADYFDYSYRPLPKE